MSISDAKDGRDPRADPRETLRRAAWLPFEVASDAEVVRFTVDELPEGARGFTFLDCGVWMGDGESMAPQRDFALVCGRTVVLCDFLGGEALAPLTVGTEAERRALDATLTALAGPQRRDVRVHRALRSPADAGAEGVDLRVHLLLPDMHFPILTPLPELNPELIPDPSLARCPCHGPIVSRILYGTPDVAPAYRAVGAMLSRNPNDWIFLMARSYEGAARDLVRLLDRIAKHGALHALHVVQLGALFEVWAGYGCVFAGNGRMAFLRPEILDTVSEDELLARWLGETLDTGVRDAVLKLVRQSASRRTLLHDLAHEVKTELHVPGVLFAEHAPRSLETGGDSQPLAFLALAEQRAQFRTWQRDLPPGFRAMFVGDAVERWRALRFPVYAMAHTLMPCLVNVELGLPSANAGPRALQR